MMKFLLSFSLSFVIDITQAQIASQLHILQWSDTTQQIEFSDYKSHEAYSFNNAVYDDSKFGYYPLFFETLSIPYSGTISVQLQDAVYEIVPNQLRHPLINNIVKDEPVISTSVGYVRGMPQAQITILPFRISGNELERLKSFSYVLNIVPSGNGNDVIRGQDSWAVNSVLASGSWYKISVSKNGVYKLDKSFLESLGISTSQIDPRNIRIYGNGGGMLPEANAAFRYDDLQENAIEVVGESDGSFDGGDYVLFYAQGPDSWSYDQTNSRFTHELNLYSKYNYYYITTSLGQGKRIQSQPSSSQSANVTVNDFDDYAFHESELENVNESGKTWYGESFEFETSQSFPFSFSNISSSSPVNICAKLMSRSLYASCSFKVTVNNQYLSSVSIPTVCEDYTCPFGNETTYCTNVNTTNSSINVQVDYVKGASDAVGYLDYIEVNLKRKLQWAGSQMNFRSVESSAIGNISTFNLGNASGNLAVWDVSDIINVKKQNTDLNGNQLSFTLATDSLKEFAVFSGSDAYTPTAVGKISNQNLHATPQVDMVIISAPQFLSYANQIADLHRTQDNMSVAVVQTDEVYNEYGSGKADISAIRDFVRMLYVRAEGDSTQMPKYLLLFGDGSYDNRGNIEGYQSLIPTYQSVSSLSTTSTFVSDDFFGMLDENEGGNIIDGTEKLDIGIGRLPVGDDVEAAAMVNKIKIYTSPQSFGNWRNTLTFVADDEDYDLHVNDCDEIATNTADANPVYNLIKIYLDSYQQISISGGTRYPDVNTAIQNQLYNGTLIFNYVGHGGPAGLALERIFSLQDIQGLTNICKLACFVTATCEFSKYDDPALKSAGEYLLMNSGGGAIAMVTTVRLVYSSANKIMNQNFMSQVFLQVNGVKAPLGTVFMTGKNNTPGDANNRKFTLLGDPALTLAYPKLDIQTTSINGHAINSVPDTIKALQKVTITGEVTDENGMVQTGFNGTIYPTVYDKPVTYQTLANDPDSYVKNFVMQKNELYNGKASVIGGHFSFTFIVPKDIQYNYGFGKLSYYANASLVDANGFTNNVIIGGVSDTATTDNVGPTIKIYMNDENFAYGGLTDENPTVYLKLSDESGLNTAGTGIGHDITGVLDNNSASTYVMNDFYQADLDSYQSGEVHYPLKNMTEGSHTLVVKAWDVYDNSSTAQTEFVVAGSAQMALDHVLNYPNPFTTKTEFMFEHNMPSENLDVMIQVYTVSGRLIKTIRDNVTPEMEDGTCSDAGSGGGYHVRGIYWDGRDDYGDPIGKGVYVYRVSVRAGNGMDADAFQKLVILK